MIILAHLLSLTLVLGLLVIGAGVGGRCLRAGRLEIDDPLEALLFRTAVGLGVLATVVLVVGMAVSVHPLVLAGLLVGTAVASWRDLRAVPALARGAVTQIRASTDRFNLSVLGIVAGFLILRALAPPVDWDALMYHLRIPAQFLQHGTIYFPEDNTHVSLVGLPHMLYLPLLAAGGEAAPALLSAVCTLGLVLAGFAFARRFLGDRTAAASLAVAWGSAILLLVAVSPRTDTILAFYLFLAHYAVLRSAKGCDAGWLYLAAALGGMAVGVKYLAMAYLLVLTPLGLWAGMRLRKNRVRLLAVVVGIGVVAALPWLLKNVVLLGDPVYPFLGGRQLDPWLAQLYGTTRFPAHVDPAAADLLWQAQSPFNLLDYFTAPERITLEAEGRFYHPNFLLLLLPLGLFMWRNAVLGWLAGPALGYAALVVAVQPNTSLRYLIPALLPLTLVALHVYTEWCARTLATRWVRALLGATTLLVLAGTASVMFRELTRGKGLTYAVGLASRHDFLAAHTDGYDGAKEFVNQRVPAGQERSGLVLMLFEARGYYFRPPLLQDNLIVNWPLLADRASRDCLRSAGITHVLVNSGAVNYYRRHGMDLAPFRLDAFDAFTGACLSPVYSNGAFTVFELRPAPELARAR